ncbi:MAG: hypothetical protein Q7U40_03895 [Desulfatirhabdiaceae bacterium]|nr:hypothetical protein [Desulfatirhabdiaceae bacterium]
MNYQFPFQVVTQSLAHCPDLGATAIREALMEIDAHIIRALQTGLKPTHIDTHQDATIIT